MRTFTIALSLLAALAAAGCDRGSGPSSGDASRTTGSSLRDASGTTGSTVQATPPGAAGAASTPVAPSGLTNSSTAAMGNDLSNSTRASGRSNVYQPPSADNPASGAAAAPSAEPAASQGVSSQTRGTSPPPADGTVPNGTEGNSGSRRGGGKG